MSPDPDLAKRVHTLFTRAMEHDPSQRRTFVANQAGADTDLRDRVLGLLVAAERAGTFLNEPALGPRTSSFSTSTPLDPATRDPVPDAVGTYLIVGVLGTGGMATVYEAIQEHPTRRVALKVMRQSMSGGEAYQRFRFEAETLAGLQHPGIAQIYEAGAAHLGQSTPSPFFAMELIADAVPITAFADQSHMSLRDRVAMLATVCDAVHHGHQRGVIHRDLKPANILVGADARPKVIDFGIARTTDAEVRSLTARSDIHQLIGTLNYMSPEQCNDPANIDIRADVYALGVILYQLVTGSLPHDLSRCSIPQAVRIISETSPPRASTTRPEAAGDLDAIIAKAMDKDRDRRYSGADALAADIRRCLAFRPIEARPASTLEQVLKFAKRNRPLAVAICIAVATLMIGTAVASRLAYVATNARNAAEARERELEIVATFQESLLRDLDAQAMGDGLRRSITESLSRAASADSDPHPSDSEQWLRMSADLNFTAIAIQSLREGALDRYRAGIDTQFDQQPLLRARLTYQLAITMHELGLHADAEPLLRETLTIQHAELGPDHPDTLQTASRVASLLSTLGRYDEALALASETHARLSETLGPEAPATLRSAVTLGGVHRRMNNLPEAERLWNQSLAVQRRVLGDDNPETLRTLNNVGIIHAMRGDLTAAEACWRELLDRRREAFGPDHPDYLTSLSNLGILLQDMGRFEEARPLVEEGLAADRRHRGDLHAMTLTSMAALASLRLETGDLAGAEALQRECLQGRLKSFGPDHSETLLASASLALILHERGDHAIAQQMLRDTLNAQRRVLGPDHPETLASLISLAGMLRDAGDLADAETLCEEALTIAIRSLPAEHWTIGRIRSMQGELLAASDRPAEALPVLLEGHRLLSNALGDLHPQTRAAARRLATFYEAAHARDPSARHDLEAARWKSAADATHPPKAGTPR